MPAFLLDMDGVLYHGDRVLPDARSFIKRIASVPHLFVTNNSAAASHGERSEGW